MYNSSNNLATPQKDMSYCDKSLFPLPYLLFFVGYVTILIFDRVVLSHSHGSDSDH